jgi:hypothetical protein
MQEKNIFRFKLSRSEAVVIFFHGTPWHGKESVDELPATPTKENGFETVKFN